MAKTVWGGLLAAVFLAGALACGGDPAAAGCDEQQ